MWKIPRHVSCGFFFPKFLDHQHHDQSLTASSIILPDSDLDYKHPIWLSSVQNIHNAFGVQWELNRIALKHAQRLASSDQTGEDDIFSHIKECPVSENPPQFLQPNRQTSSILSGPLSTMVSSEVWEELDLEFQADLKSNQDTLGDIPHHSYVGECVEDGESSRESRFQTDWYGGKLTFSGKIFPLKHHVDSFGIELMPPRMGRSSILKRRFGSHSFLQLDSDRVMMTSHICPHFAKFLRTSIKLLGRRWQAFDVDFDSRTIHYVSLDPAPKDSLTCKPTESHVKKSLEGFFSKRHRELANLESFVRWYCPLEENLHQSFHALSSRFKLGRSPTVPSIIFDPSNIMRGEDRKGVDDVILNNGLDRNSKEACATDGNGWMNIAAFEVLRQYLKEEVPRTAIQARICGCKGTW